MGWGQAPDGFDAVTLSAGLAAEATVCAVGAEKSNARHTGIRGRAHRGLTGSLNSSDALVKFANILLTSDLAEES